MTDKQIIIEDCPNFIGGCCQEYLDGVCENHKCDLKIIRELEQKLKAKEQECEELKIYIESNEQQVKEVETLVMDNDRLINELDQLKAEVKSKTEYIQEQRDIINQYSKEIEMYKKCQGKRASKREEELKAENDNIKETFDGLFKVQYKLADTNKKLRQCLTKIKEIAESYNHYSAHAPVSGYSDILQKISECEGNDE